MDLDLIQGEEHMVWAPFVPRRLSLILLVFAAMALSACAEKARSIQVGATQFQVESSSAIDKIDALRAAEVAVPPESVSAAADKFVSLVEGSSGAITDDMLKILQNPAAIGTPASKRKWDEFLGNLRGQYATFASTFASLDKGSLLAAPVVKDAIPPLNKLTAQMAAFAKTIQRNPARFVIERAFIAEDLESVRNNTILTPAQKRVDLLRLRDRLLRVVANEKQVTDQVVAQALKATKLGLELRKLLAAYDTLSIDDLMGGLAFAFQAAGTITGRDLSGLQAKTDGVIAELTATPELKTLFNSALASAGKSLGS